MDNTKLEIEIFNPTLTKDEKTKFFCRDFESLKILLQNDDIALFYPYLFNKPATSIYYGGLCEWLFGFKKNNKSNHYINLVQVKLLLNHKYFMVADNDYMFVFKDILIRFELDINTNQYIIKNANLFYGIDTAKEDMDEIRSLLKNNIHPKKENKKITTISLITQSNAGIKTIEEAIKKPKLDINLNYHPDLPLKITHIEKELSNKDKSGLILFHGTPGTGKTTLLTWFLAKISQTQKVIFVPSHLTSVLSDPSFITFMINNKNSVLVIEDAENILQSREDGNTNPAIVNILNISDGILGKILNIKIIATFNTKRENIDGALLRKGRLMAEHEFKALPMEQAKLVGKSIGLPNEVIDTIKEDTPLCDIYALKTETSYTDEVSLKKERKRIGF